MKIGVVRGTVVSTINSPFFDQQRLLIRELEISSRDNSSETDLRIRLTLSRFVRLEEQAEEDDGSRRRAGWGTPASFRTDSEGEHARAT